MMASIRLLGLSSLAAGSFASFQIDGGAAAKASRGPAIVGAIRWDAYFATPGTPAFEDPNFGIVSRTTTYDMSPKKWHYRLPFFAKELNDTSVVRLEPTTHTHTHTHTHHGRGAQASLLLST